MTLGIVHKIYPDRTADIFVGGKKIPRVSGYPTASVGETVLFANGIIQQNPGASKVKTPTPTANVRFVRTNDVSPRPKLFYAHVDDPNPTDCYSAFFMLIDHCELFTSDGVAGIALPATGGFKFSLNMFAPIMPNTDISGHFYNNTSHLGLTYYSAFHPDSSCFEKIDDHTIDITQLNAGFDTTWSRLQRTYTGFDLYHDSSERTTYTDSATGTSAGNAEANVAAIMFSSARIIAASIAAGQTIATDVTNSGEMPHTARLYQMYLSEVASTLPTFTVGATIPADLLSFCVIQEIVLDTRIFFGTVSIDDNISLIVDNPGYYVGIGDSDFYQGVCNGIVTNSNFVRIKIAYLPFPGAVLNGSETIKIEPFISHPLHPYVVTGTGPSEVIRSSGHYALHIGEITFTDETDYRNFNLTAPTVLYTSTRQLDTFQRNNSGASASNEFFGSRSKNYDFFKSLLYPNPPENAYTKSNGKLFGDPDPVSFANVAGGGFILPNNIGVVPPPKQGEGWVNAPLENKGYGPAFGNDNGLPAIIKTGIDYDDFSTLEPYCHSITFPYHYFRSHIPWAIMMANSTIPPFQASENISIWHTDCRGIFYDPVSEAYDFRTFAQMPIYVELPLGSTVQKNTPYLGSTYWPPTAGTDNTTVSLDSITPFKSYSDSYSNTFWYQRHQSGGSWIQFSEGPLGILHDYHVTTTGSGSSWTATASNTLKWQGTATATQSENLTKYNGISTTGTGTADFTLELHVYRIKIYIPPIDPSQPAFGLVSQPFPSENSLLCRNKLRVSVGSIAPTDNLPTDLGFYPTAMEGFTDFSYPNEGVSGSILGGPGVQVEFTFLPPDRPFGIIQ